MPMQPVTADGRPLAVAQLIETMAMGGAEHLAVRIANHLAAAGHESHLIVLRGPDVLSARIAPGVRVHYLEFERASIGNPLRFAVSLRRGLGLIREIVTRERISVVQTHLPGANFFGLLLAWRHVCAVVPTVHNNQEFNYGDADNPWLIRLRKWAYRRMLHLTQGMVAVSQEVKDSLISELGVGLAEASRICVATNAVGIPAALPGPLMTEIRAGFGCGADDVLVLAAGRFCEQKNFGDLIAAAARLREAGVGFQLVIAGAGQQWAELADQVRRQGLGDWVTLPGNMTNLDDVMQAADLFVMSSLWEGLPLVLLEAMAAGLPTVAYRIPGIEEVVVDGESGLLAAVGDQQALADQLAVLIAARPQRLSLGQAGREIIRTRYNFEEYVSLLRVQYEQAAQHFSGGAR